MSLIALNTNEKASDLLARLQSLGVEIETGCNSSTSIAYAANGLVLRQKEFVSTTEYVGLTPDAAKKLEELDEDGSTTTIYYKAIPNANGEYAAVSVTTGLKTDYVPSRDGESGAWKCVKTVTTFSAASDDGWSTDRPAVSSSGIVVSETSMKQFVAVDAFNRSYFQNESVVIREFPFLSAAESAAKIAANTASGSRTWDVEIPTSWSTLGGITETKNIQLRSGADGAAATDKVASRRYDGPERGWVVTVTETTYSVTGS